MLAACEIYGGIKAGQGLATELQERRGRKCINVGYAERSYPTVTRCTYGRMKRQIMTIFGRSRLSMRMYAENVTRKYLKERNDCRG